MRSVLCPELFKSPLFGGTFKKYLEAFCPISGTFKKSPFGGTFKKYLDVFSAFRGQNASRDGQNASRGGVERVKILFKVPHTGTERVKRGIDRTCQETF